MLNVKCPNYHECVNYLDEYHYTYVIGNGRDNTR